MSYRIFKSYLLTAVEDEKLESFYLSLGSRSLSETIQMRVNLGPLSINQEPAEKVLAHILERAKLFLHEVRRAEIKHDYQWLEKRLKVQVVTSIELGRKLVGLNVRHREKRTAACDFINGYQMLCITGGNVSLYQISTSICKLLLDRPGQSHMITFEQFLSLSLVDLKNRGYNVDRILRLKAAEQRFAEEERQKQLAIEQENIRQQDKLWNQNKQLQVHPELDHVDQAMPGSFADSPESSPTPAPQDNSRFSLAGFMKGRGNFGQLGQQVQRALGGGSSVVSTQEQERPDADVRSALNPGGQKPKPEESERVTSPAALQANLLAAIRASRPHNANYVFSKPTTNVIKEQATYCDSTTEHNMICLAETNNSTRIFVNKDQPAPGEFLQENAKSLSDFAVLLRELCGVYHLDPAVMHIFYDPAGATIAFNANGSIFCNYRYFLQLHRDNLKKDRATAGSYWWVVIAHELAHNLVGPHNAQHSYYT